MTAKIAFTYDIETAVGQVRLYAGDTDGAGLNRTGGDRTRTDSEILFLLSQNGDEVRAAAAELLECRAAEYAQQAVRVDQGRLRQDFTERGVRCQESAKTLRAHVVRSPIQAAPEPTFTAGTMERW